jgi:hypothetical protein
MSSLRSKLEKKFSKQLNGYKYIDVKKTTTDTLKTGYYGRYIKTGDELDDAHVVLGGKITEILEDRDNPKKIYKIQMETRYGNLFSINIKNNENIFFYYKTMTVVDMRLKQAEEWVKQLTPYERRKFKEMKKKRDDEVSKAKKRRITNEYYKWLYARRPELDTRKKNNVVKKKVRKTKKDST